MSQPDQAHAVVRRARPASTPAAAPLRVVSERVGPDAVADPTPAAPPPAGPAQMRAGFRHASATPSPLAVASCPQPWLAPTWPPRGTAGAPRPDAAARSGPASGAATVGPFGAVGVAPYAPVGAAPLGALPVGPAAGPVHLAMIPGDAPAAGAELVPARSLLPVPACPPPRSLLARLMALLSGRRDPAGRHRPDSIESPAWSMCTRRRRRSGWRTR